MILFPDSILLMAPELNANLPQRPDDPGVAEPETPEDLEIEAEWQDFYNEALPEFLISEGYVRTDEEGELLPGEEVRMEAFLERLIAIYDGLRVGERLANAYPLDEEQDYEERDESEGDGELRDGESQDESQSDEPLTDEPRTDEPQTEDPVPGEPVRTAVNEAAVRFDRVRATGQTWREGGIGI